MARLRNRSDYLEDYSPGDASELLGGSRYSEFLSLPGSSGDLSGRLPTTYTSALFDSLSKFKSKEKDQGTNFERFLNLQRNPDYMADSAMKLPTGFNQTYNLMSSLT